MTEFMNTDGSFGDMSTAPEELQSLVTSKKFAGVGDLAQAYTNLEGMKGDWANPESMKLPENFSPEQLITINGKRGVPENLEGYSYEAAEGVETDEDMLAGFKDFALKGGLTQDQFAAGIEFWNQAQSQGVEANNTILADLIEKGNASLKDEWKEAFDDNTEKANSFGTMSGLDKIFENYGITEMPDVKAALFKLSGMTEEGKLPNAEVVITKSKEEQLKELTSNPAYTNAMDPTHKSIIAAINKLHGIS